MPALIVWPVSGSLIATTSATRGEQRAPDRAPARVVHELEQEEVREQQQEQAGVAVDEADEVVAELHRAAAYGAARWTEPVSRP